MSRPSENPAYQPLLRIAVVLSAGIIVDRLVSVSPICTATLLVLSLLIWCWAFVRGKFHAATICLFLCVFSWGALWHQLHWNWFGNRDLATFATNQSSPAIVRGRVNQQPKWVAADPGQEQDRHRGMYSRFQLSVESIRSGEQFWPVSGNVVVFVDGRVQGIACGELLECTGTLARIRTASNPGQFDAQMFFRGTRTLSVLNVQSADSLRSIADGLVVSRLMSGARDYFDRLLWTHLSADSAPLASAMLLGNREQLDRVARENYLLSGTVHLLAISGLHVGILASLFLLLPRLGLLSRRKGLFLTVLFVFLYAWLVEFRPPVTRAAVLVSVYCYCRWIGRTPFSFNALALAVLIVVGLNPAALFSAGAQLSFLAVGSIIYFARLISPAASEDPIDRLLIRSRTPLERARHRFGNKIRVAFAVSAVIWLFSMPAVASQFHVVAPIALLANPLLLVPVTIALFCGLGLLIFGGWLPPVAYLLACGCEASMQSIQGCVEFCSQIPAGHWWTAGPDPSAVAIFYSALLALFVLGRTVTRWFIVAFLSVWLLAGWVLPDWNAARDSQHRETLTCHFLDMGHGVCVLLELPNGRHIMYDCGSFGSPRKARSAAAGLLWQRRIRHLDAVLLSHADSDHFNGLPDLVRQFSIGAIFVSDRFVDSTRQCDVLDTVLEDLETAGSRVVPVQTGDQCSLSEQLNLKILGPPADGWDDTDNANSIVLEIEFRGQRILLAGDLEGSGMDELLKQTPRRYDVVLAPHHGSKHSRPHDFLAWSQPRYCVISGHRRKVSDLQHLQHRPGTQILHTARDGAIRIDLDGTTISVSTWFNHKR